MKEQRTHFYTDRQLQGYLLVAFVVLEVVLVSALILNVYADIQGILEDQMYRIHRADSVNTAMIFDILGKALGYFLLVNIVALYLAHAIWTSHVKHICSLFSRVLSRLSDLDFTQQPAEPRGRHHVVDLVLQWYEKEQQRNQALASVRGALSGYESRPVTELERVEIKKLLVRYRALLDGS